MEFTKAICPLHAYLDPGAGSMMLQVLLGGSAAVLVVLKLTWRRLLGFVGFTRPTSSAGQGVASRS